MNWLLKIANRTGSKSEFSVVRRVRYASLAVALAGLAWTVVTLANTRQHDHIARIRLAAARRQVGDLRLQIARQRTVAATLPHIKIDEESSVESLVARVGDAARQAGMTLAQSRAVASSASAQVPAPSLPGQTAPTPHTDAGAVEFHLTGSYAALRQMLKTLGESHSRFQVVTLDILRAGVTASTGAAHLDIRLVCTL